MAKILLIEDEQGVLEMLADELSVQGYDVLESQNGEDGFSKFIEERPDIVLCDRDLPGLSGYDLLKRIRAEHADRDDTPFIFLTALTDPRDKEAVDHLRPSAYLDKPVDFTVLTDMIKKLLR